MKDQDKTQFALGFISGTLVGAGIAFIAAGILSVTTRL